MFPFDVCYELPFFERMMIIIGMMMIFFDMMIIMGIVILVKIIRNLQNTIDVASLAVADENRVEDTAIIAANNPALVGTNNILADNTDALLGLAIPIALAANKNGSTDEAAYDPLPPTGAVEHNRVGVPTACALHQHPNVVEDNINNNNNNKEEEEEKEDSDGPLPPAVVVPTAGAGAGAGQAGDIVIVPNVVDEDNNNNNNNNNINNNNEEEEEDDDEAHVVALYSRFNAVDVDVSGAHRVTRSMTS